MLLVTGIAQAVQAQPAGSTLRWEPRQFEATAPAGSTSSATLGFTYTGPDIADPQIGITGPAGTVIQVDLQGMRPRHGGAFELPVAITLPGEASGVLPGSLQLRNGRTPVGPALPVRIVVATASGIPSSPLSPSDDRITETADGLLVVRDEVVLGVELDAADPAAVALDAASSTGARIIGASPALRLYQLRYAGSTLAETEARLSSLEGLENIEFATLNVVDRDPEAIPDDSEWDGWDVGAPAGNNWGLEFIDAPAAWDLTTGSADIGIAVIDADNDEDHGDLDDNVVRSSRGGAANGHGTHVAGTACAEGDNATGITGLLWDCSLSLYAYGTDSVSTADAMRRAADDGNRVINMSLQFIENNNAVPITPGLIQAARDTNDIFGRAVVHAQRGGLDVLWVFAAGNESGRDVLHTAPGGLAGRFPTNTIAVAAVGRDGSRAGFSNTGELVSVAAPGVDIFSTMPRTGCWFFSLGCDDNYEMKNGTSMAAPHVTGLAGLVLAADPARTAADVKTCIVSAALADGEAVPSEPYSVINAPGAVACEGTLDLPPQVDVVLAFDLTGSMGGVIDQAKREMVTAIEAVAAAAPGSDLRYSVVSYEDYPGVFDSRPCGSSYVARYGYDSDQPFRINGALGTDTVATQAAINGLSLGNGADGPESYGRAFWEIAQVDTGSALGFRPDALKLIINFGDNVPHDTNINEGVEGATGVWDTGIDPGRNGAVDCGGDDIDFQDVALASLRDSGIRLLHVDSSGWSGIESHWRTWTSITGGGYTRLGSDRSLSEVIVELLTLI